MPPEYRFADLIDDAEWVSKRLLDAICEFDDADYRFTKVEDRFMRREIAAHELAEAEARHDLARRRYDDALREWRLAWRQVEDLSPAFLPPRGHAGTSWQQEARRLARKERER